jgi:hypothetical protein
MVCVSLSLEKSLLMNNSEMSNDKSVEIRLFLQTPKFAMEALLYEQYRQSNHVQNDYINNKLENK